MVLIFQQQVPVKNKRFRVKVRGFKNRGYCFSKKQ